MPGGRLAPIRGRGARLNPPSRFEPLAWQPDPAAADPDLPAPRTRFLKDASRTVLSRHDSPDVAFEVSLNPYRGCEHGCAYCYARPTHEYLGFSAGLDFETTILVKEDAPALLRQELAAADWRPVPIALSGVTDPYQPAERKLELTRRCLEVLAEFRNPVGIVTKNHLVTRDLDLLVELARHEAASVTVSVTTLDLALQRDLEPRTAPPFMRLQAVRRLASAGVPVGVLVAPVIPALTDHELPGILCAAAQAGARWAGKVVLRLPHAVKELFTDWLATHRPDAAKKVLNRIRALRGGKLYDAAFGTRMRGEGAFADQIDALYEAGLKKSGLARSGPPLSTTAFRRPSAPGDQLALFDLPAVAGG